MTNIIPASKRRFADHGWLRTFWLFSFSDYYDRKNIQWGKLRVFNDDVIDAETGFPTHHHEEMEIITIPLSGELTHKDSMGNTGIIGAGDVQHMSAGTGILHSEYNNGSEPVHLYQIWIFPDKKDLEPSYDQRHFEPEQWKNRLLAVASGQEIAGAVTFNTDATIYRSQLDAGSQIEFETSPERRIFIYVTAGKLKVNEEELQKNDQARIKNEEKLILMAEKDTELILIDVPAA